MSPFHGIVGSKQRRYLCIKFHRHCTDIKPNEVSGIRAVPSCLRASCAHLSGKMLKTTLKIMNAEVEKRDE